MLELGVSGQGALAVANFDGFLLRRLTLNFFLKAWALMPAFRRLLSVRFQKPRWS